MARVNISVSGALGQFSFWVANGTVGLPILEGIDYRPVLMTEPSAMQLLYAIFVNVLEVDDDGNVLNEKYAEQRAAQWLRSYIDRDYKMELPLEPWEDTLYDAGSRAWALPPPGHLGAAEDMSKIDPAIEALVNERLEPNECVLDWLENRRGEVLVRLIDQQLHRSLEAVRMRRGRYCRSLSFRRLEGKWILVGCR